MSTGTGTSEDEDFECLVRNTLYQFLYGLAAAVPRIRLPCSVDESVSAGKLFVESYKEQKVRFGDIRKELTEQQKKTRKSRYYRFTVGHEEHSIFYFFVQRMLKGQTVGLKMQVLADLQGNSRAHRPVVTIKPPKFTRLPLKVARLIFSHCSAETCVQLRQASVEWYLAFQSSEDVLKVIINARSPWIVPEGTLKSWGDCLLVFSVRRWSSKWTMVDHLPNVQDEGVHWGKEKPLVALELDQDDRLPSQDLYLQPAPE
ncbi:hypothetical protein CJU89_5842 [Yarrowia sp. B02]|nr:hypothetical protein CJU89_5842 [Yarrowia sp. B02]